MVFDNLKIRHTTFGEGIVKMMDGKYMTASFGSIEKKFVYPDAFENTKSDGLRIFCSVVAVKNMIRNRFNLFRIILYYI